MVAIDRTQTGVRMERRLLKVLKGLAEYLDLTLGDLLEGIVLHAFEQKVPFDDATVATIERLQEVYGLDLTAADSHRLRDEPDEEVQVHDAMPCRRVQLTGTVEIALPPQEAFILFTPSGERAWAQGWDPKFPSPSPDETDPGTVFQTDHGGGPAIWTVVHSEPGSAIGYSMTAPGDRSGLVSVSCRPSAAGTTATVSYDMTALTPEANVELDRFASNFPHFLGHWEWSISHAPQRSHSLAAFRQSSDERG